MQYFVFVFGLFSLYFLTQMSFQAVIREASDKINLEAADYTDYPNFNDTDTELVPRIGQQPPCLKEETFCDKFFTGYPYMRMKYLLRVYQIPKHFFITEDPPLEPINRWDDEEMTPCKYATRTIFPTLARNKFNKWRYIFNNPTGKEYSQSVVIEICRNPDKPCDFIGDQRIGFISRCKQKYMYRRLFALNEQGKPGIDMFMLPSACVCSLRREFGQFSRMPGAYFRPRPFPNRNDGVLRNFMPSI